MYQIFYLWYWWNNFLNINCVLYFCFSWNSWNNYCPSKAFQVLTDIFVDFWQPANRVWWARFLCKFELYHACDIAGIVLKKRSLDVNLHITRFLLFRLNYCLQSNSALLFTSLTSQDLIFMNFYSLLYLYALYLLLYHQRILFFCTFIQFFTIKECYFH